MKTDYNNLLKTAIEIEGLIRVAIANENTNVEIATMLAEKSAALAAALAIDCCSDMETDTAPCAATDEALSAEPTPVVEDSLTTHADDMADSDAVEDVINEDDHDVEEADTDGSPFCIEVAESEVVTEEPECVTTETDSEDYDDDFATDEMAEAESEGMTTQVDDFDTLPHRLEDKLARQAAGDLSHLFSLNDKFRFRRELFDNSQESFDETLQVLGEMASLEEVYEYLADDLCLDIARPEVKDFIAIISKNFA